MLAHVYSCAAASGYQYTMTRRPMKGCLVLRGKLLYTVSSSKKTHPSLINTSTTQTQTQHLPLSPSPPSWLCCALLLLNQKQVYQILQAPPSLAEQSTSGPYKGLIDVCYCRSVVLLHNYLEIREYFHFLVKRWQLNHWFMQTLTTVWNNMGVNQASSRGFVKCFAL